MLDTPSSPTPPWRWFVPRLGPALMAFGFCLAAGLWQGNTSLLALRADGRDDPWTRPFLWEVTGVLAAWVALPIPLTAVENAPHPRGHWLRFLGLHLGAFVLFETLQLTLMLGSRHLLYPLLGWGPYLYGPWSLRLPMEVQKILIPYLGIALGYALYLAWKRRQVATLHAARLATELKEARLQALTGQLNPHFLFNVLNTVSSLMYEDLARTDRLLADLGQVLRASLEAHGPTWSLAEERAHTERFVALLAARFGDRLALRWELEPGLERAEVPRFALQLLVENAVKHNQDRPGPLELRLRVRREAETLVLEAEDTGRGFATPSPARGAGLGLRHLEQALGLLHGAAARLERGTGPEGGARVRLVLPKETP
jgi:two-component system LytT family sensor kinase